MFLDEPTTDPQNRANLWEQILTTHYLEEADGLADRLSIMDHGKIVAEGTPIAIYIPFIVTEHVGVTSLKIYFLFDIFP